VRPLRFATILATLTAIAILLGQLWLRSIDGRTTISLGQAAREARRAPHRDDAHDRLAP
jgi:hypothetical protein